MATIPIGELSQTLAEQGGRWSPGLSRITGLSEQQQRQLLGVIVDHDYLARLAAAPAVAQVPKPVAIPPAVDWRNVGGVNYVTPVKDQGNCGSCVSFCTTATVESTVLIQHKETLDLSEADLHFCSAHGPSCGGWWPSNALDELKSRGVPDEACFPYASAFDAAGNPSCKTCADRAQRAVRITGYSTLTTTADRKAWLAAQGTLCAVFHVYNDFFSYAGGTYHHVAGAEAGYHCVEVVGYSDADAAWICKNSWGSGWGDHGFFKIGYGQCGIDDTSTDKDANGNVLRFPMWGVQGAILPAHQPSWSGWESLGGVITSGAGAASWAPNRLDVFAKGTDNHMWHRWWDGSAWRGWEDLGGVIDDAPAAVSWGPNRIDTFVRGMDNALYHKWWDGISWKGWERLGGNITSGPAVASWAANRLDVFAKGDDNAMWHLWWDGSAWRGWENLGGGIDGNPAAVSWGPNRIDTFVRGLDNALYHKWWDGHAWSGWENLGGNITSGPAVASWAANRLDVFAKGDDNHMWHRWWDGSAWRGWEDLGGGIDDNPAAVSWGANRIDTFVRGLDNALWHKWWG
jgi:Papain family cysteine protease/Repeat of unknown function (DUF346)